MRFIRNARRALLAAWWAAKHADTLTMLYHEMSEQAKECEDVTTGLTDAAFVAERCKRQLESLPIR